MIRGEKTHWFPMLYFNLEFVVEKLAVTGPSDLLNDYEKYKEHLDQTVTGILLNSRLKIYRTVDGSNTEQNAITSTTPLQTLQKTYLVN